MMNQPGKSDKPVVPEKSSNKTRTTAAEGMEGRGLAKGNSEQQNASRTLGRSDAHSALERVRGTARRNKEVKFTALMHHIYNLESLRAAYYQLQKEAAPGVDGETWQHYGEALEENLQDLSHRLRRGAYQAKPVRRVYIPKLAQLYQNRFLRAALSSKPNFPLPLTARLKRLRKDSRHFCRRPS